MAKKVLQINKYTGGLNSYSDPRDLKEDEFQVLDNASVDEEGIIRVSGALEIKDNIQVYNDNSGFQDLLLKSGKGLFSFSSDYFLGVSALNSYLEGIGGGGLAWGVTDIDGDGFWNFSQSSTSNTSDFSVFDIQLAAINEINYSASSNTSVSHNHGSLTFQGITLIPGASYRLSLDCISENPWYYMGANIPPRIRLYNEAIYDSSTNQINSRYYSAQSGDFMVGSDETHTSMLDNDSGNFVSSVSSESTGAGGHITFENGSWTASTGAYVTKVDMSDTAPHKIEMIIDSDNQDFTSSGEWIVYTGGTQSVGSGILTVNPTTATSIEGVQLPIAKLQTLIPGETYTVSAKIVSTSGNIPNFKIGLGGVLTEPFTISTSTTAITKDLTVTSDAALLIYYEDATDVNWYIDDVSVKKTHPHKTYNSFFGSTETSGTITN